MLQNNCVAYDLLLQKVKNLDEFMGKLLYSNGAVEAARALYPLHILTALLKVHYMPRAAKAQEVSDLYMFQRSNPLLEGYWRS
jgi:hypothetical protein